MCVFCDIAAGRAPAKIVYEDDVVIAFLDIDPINEGHVLVVPKMHISDFAVLPEGVYLHLMSVARRIAAAITAVYRPDGVSMMQNGGKFCDFGHMHIHVFPRYTGDGFGWTCSDQKFPVTSEAADAIRRAMK